MVKIGDFYLRAMAAARKGFRSSRLVGKVMSRRYVASTDKLILVFNVMSKI